MSTVSFSGKLLGWFEKNARPMPWRDLEKNPDPYRVWVSEMMLQQTTVATVTGYYGRWLTSFPGIMELARADEQEVLKCWQGLGYYSRARNMLKAARMIIDRHHGKLPSTREDLLKLPGVGPYTASAVASIAFGEPVALVDANVRRVMMRILGIDDVISVMHDDVILEQLRRWIPLKKPGHFNQAMMELGALICKPKEPTCNLCPVRSHCQAYARGVQEVIPRPLKKVVKDIRAVIAIIEKDGKILIQQRPAKGLLAGLWEFPGGKIEPSDDSPQAALQREVLEETGLEVEVGDLFGKVTHTYTQFRVALSAYHAKAEGKWPVLPEHLCLVSKTRLREYPMPSGSARILDKYLGS